MADMCNMGLASVTCYLIEPDPDTRSRLKRSLDDSGLFKQIFPFEAFEDAKKALVRESTCDIAFISDRFQQIDSADFISHCRKTENGKETVFILAVFSSREAKQIPRQLIGGFSGILVEPYSLDVLSDVVELAKKVKIQLRLEIDKKMLGILVKQVFGELDVLYTLNRYGLSAKKSKQALQDSCSTLRALNKEQLLLFYELAVEYLQDCPPSQLLPEDFSYDGKSKRVPIRIENDLMSKLYERLAQN